MATVNWTGVTTAGDFLATANTTTGGWFWTGMLYMAVIVMLLAMIPIAGFEAALMISLFIGIISGIMLFYAELISGTWLGVLVAAELFFILYSIVNSYKNQ